jgi:arylsulfatase A-like enzyme
MTKKLTRREFIKLASILSFTPLLARGPIPLPKVEKTPTSTIPANIIVILFDTFSARHISLYGYPRKTTPNLEKFANKAIIYHRHYSPANFTTPSTASFLTGVYPWTHRAFHIGALVDKKLANRNLFSLIGDRYSRTGFAHNLFADALLFQFDEYLDQHIDIGEYGQIDNTIYNHLFSKDALAAFRSFDEFLMRGDLSGSLFLSYINNLNLLARYKYYQNKYAQEYPRGIPNAGAINLSFVLESLFAGVERLLSELPQPSLAYIHLFPPHEPYYPNKKYVNKFNDNLETILKPESFFSEDVSNLRLDHLRVRYDQYIANVDAEFGALIDHMEKIGLLDNSYVIVTSDHGQLFERGVHGHSTPLLYESLIHIPLIISKPQQSNRQDVLNATNTVDLLPTILGLTGQEIPDWCEGHPLPGLGGTEQADRSIFSIEANRNPAYEPLTKASLTLIKDQFKLIHYIGYPGYEDVYELYDLKNDPEELVDLYASQSAIGRELQAELEKKVAEANQPYLKNH